MSLLPAGCIINGMTFSSCQLQRRHWIIRCNNRVVSNVRGAAVIGMYPFLLPGQEEFVYQSCTPLPSSPDSVKGSFTFVPGSYSRAKQRYSKNGEEKLSPGHHLASAAEAGGLVCLCTNPVWLVKTRLQLQTPLHQTRPYSGLYDAFTTILKEEGWRSLYRGIVPGLFLVSHGVIQFTAYEELRKVIVDFSSIFSQNSVDYAILGGSSKIAAILFTYPFQVIGARLQVWIMLKSVFLYICRLNHNSLETGKSLHINSTIPDNLSFSDSMNNLNRILPALSSKIIKDPVVVEFRDIWIAGML
ncbi:Folate transporter 1, chloroplastic [Melia azedarach]|uniref:Folate transporter 1, chloroplastic n=1 Tax=Melia azedarach TaxID=155640 RepID=A0ACC1YIM4_MELAZ|nr:Folate transporter 1, chloroplastic [Melia azedarach]